MINRQLRDRLVASKKSILLLGPRQTGKSTLIQSLKPDLTLNLAHEPTYLEFLRDPTQLEQRLAVLRQPASVFIDEVQRIPSLLNTLQVILDDPRSRLRFYLTGSSARKLKRGHANLLPGRLHVYHLSSLSCGEFGFRIDTAKALAYGTLPGIWSEEDAPAREKTLRSYASTYLKEEVQAENLARNLEGFTRFLYHAAAVSGQFLDLSKLAFRAQISRQTAVRFFEVLEDCLLIRRIDPFSKSSSRRLVQHPRFLFFDLGVLNGLLGNFEASPDRLGHLFEQLVLNQIFNEASGLDLDLRLSSYRTEHGAEVDVVIEAKKALFAIEIKAATAVGTGDLRGLLSFRNYIGKAHRSLVLYRGMIRKQLNGVEIWPWQEGIKELFKAMG